METLQEQAICCSKLDPTQWDDKIFEWENKKFIKHKVKTFFNIPVNLFGSSLRPLELNLNS